MSQCTATAKSTGERCKRSAIKGGNVCQVHGGSASQVKEKAKERLRKAVMPAIAELIDMVEDAEKESVKIKAIENVLDRAGYPKTKRQELTGEDGGPVEVDNIVDLPDVDDENED